MFLAKSPSGALWSSANCLQKRRSMIKLKKVRRTLVGMRRAPVIELSTVFLEAMLAERMVEKQKFFSANWKFISGIKIYTRVLKIEGKKYNNFSRKIDAAIEDARSRMIISWIRNAEACCDAGLCKNKNHRSARRSNVSKMQNSKLAPVQLLFQRLNGA